MQTAKNRAKVGYPPFSEFCKFMKKEARISSNPVTSPQALKGEDKGNKERARSRFQLRERSPGAGAFATNSQGEEVIREKRKGVI